VIDGETIEVTINEKTFTVRYLGIDAPNDKECYTAQARTANLNLVNGKRVVLESDVTNTDAEGRLLRYVYLLDGRMAQEELAKNGAARAVTAQPNIKNQALINEYERQAATAKRGAWRSCKWQPAAGSVLGECPVFQIESLIERKARLPEFSLLKDNNCVVLQKANNPASAAWQGQYVWHPAGSQVTLSNMYVRWKDGFVRITQEADGSFAARFIQSSAASIVFPKGQRPFLKPAKDEPTTKAIIREPTQQGVLRIENNAFLFRDAGNGKYTALVDVFEYKSGEFKDIVVTSDGYVQ
jgi:Staphylococcal nuclease homologue